ncbi:ATPase [Candidatus Shapirobacteria bacterium CG09_land_8_20_14_0_10_39_12]|uniref:ATPase n=1 Tax=Candidatus Shapirobacteria bacterium CG09_land_8_20_14_0_10_39_12 TaxID=1974885 RepID=A0A2H0WQ13_9BACT|nr:MAG: ATPase [Candidatus Shapirobacteria bacterium CG09_land_8_20_14_0_10_39_12]
MGRVINVVKATGEIEPFSKEKVISSLVKVGAEKELAEKIVSQIEPNLYENIPTFQIYSTVMKILKKERREIAERYSLKKAIMDLGPTGYPFEKYVAGVLGEIGYKTETNKIVSGKCVAHEIDVVAQNNKKHMIECKFHAIPGGRTDVKAALYTYARFLDVKDKGKFDTPWLITNTKVTAEVKAYALCVGMKVTAWDYPEGEGLNELIDQGKLYPVTVLTQLSEKEKRDLIDKGIVFCKDLNCKA